MNSARVAGKARCPQRAAPAQSRRPLLRAALATAAAALAGCASAPVDRAPLDPANEAASFTARSLDDPALHRFLVENLGRDPGAAWDFEALSWAAFYFHPSLAVARAQWAVSRAAQQTAAARPNPTLSLTPGYDTTRTPGLSPWMPAVNLDFLLPNTAARARQVDAARADAEAARLGVFTAAWQIRSELRRALTDAAIAARRAEQLRAQTSLQQKLLALLDQRAEAGSASRAEVSVARSALLRAEASAADAASQSAVARA
ncbi:MAG TPA: TolC family protein, partial [Opitutaceae bacterium]|nr:TolC family protein [Opitutaceae bacterium]